MLIELEFIDFVVPIDLIRQKYQGGWAQCLQDHERVIGRGFGFADHLLREGGGSWDLRYTRTVRPPDGHLVTAY